MCLHPAWTRQRFHEELDKFLAAKSSLSPIFGQWTSVDFQMRDTEGGNNTSAASSGQEHIEGAASVSGSVFETDLQTEQVRMYLQMLARSRTSASNVNPEEAQLKLLLDNAIEGSLKLAQNIKFPRQDIAGLPAVTLPAWYSTLRDIQEDKTGVASESAAIRSVSALGQVYGLSIMDQSVETSSKATDIAVDEARKILQSKESKSIEAACTGEWGSETCLDPTLTDTSLLVTKLNALQVPPLPPRLGEEIAPTQRISSLPRGAVKDGSATSASDLKPKIDTMVASSSCSPGLGHTAPIVRISVSHDQRFFVTGSHDGTCRVWETEKAEKCSGVLESSIAYENHCVDNNEGAPRINDLAMVEGGHSVVSGASDGSVHVWRVDLVSSSSKQSSASTNNDLTMYQRSRVAGSSQIRRLNPSEGEILAVNHYNSTAASVLMFASQKGYVHSWDLRCAVEPFVLKNAQGTGYLTSMALGSDRNWVVTGTSRGFLALWDLRFQQVVKLWKHSRGAPINRLATSFVPPPQSWLGRGGSNAEAKPFIFAASGPNECGMFDIIDGSCRECFRTVDYASRYSDSHLEEIPRLDEVPVSSPSRRKFLSTQQLGTRLGNVIPSSFLSINAMVGSIGPSDNSFLITGGSDSKIRYWDFIVPSKCYVSSELESVQPRPSFERIDYDRSCRLMLCRQTPSPTLGEVESSRVPRKLFQGLKKPVNHHTDSIQDLKIVKSGLVSCSRDCTVKLWR
jgi:phosphoinositide-3-kinase regulatory subunit 4